MVTYISSANADRYNLLFEKASDALGLTGEESISSLNEYFAHLEDLIAATSSDTEDISRFFVRLPLDEDLFEIDANSRTVKVPNTSFGRYGVGVQGDELAEVVYFIIDRFFDATDLASDHMYIVIQWEAKDANKNTIAGISQHFGKDIESVPGKIIFGWPISSELTKTAGSIKFAVRFYQLGEDNVEGSPRLVYSFSTLPAEVTINASLDYDIINMGKIDHGNIITSRIKSDGIYDVGSPVPKKPIITIPLYVMSPAGNGLRVVDLPAGENSMVKLAICAKNDDFGNLVYDWQKRPYDSETSSYKESLGIPSEIEYEEEIPSSDFEFPEGQEYYTVTFDEEQRVQAVYLVTEDRLATIIVDEDHFVENGNPIHLYKKLSVAFVDTVGEYFVNIKAKTTVNSSLPTTNKDEPVRIPGPLKPVINLPEESENISVTEEDNSVHAITDNGSIVLTADAVPGEKDRPADEVGEDPQVILSYTWKKVENDGSASDVIVAAPIMPTSVLPTSQLPDDPAWLENASEDDVPGAKGIFNQENVDIIQNGTIINIYTRATLKEFESTNSAQGTHQWLALDINTGLDYLEGATWDDGEHDVYTFEATDENDLGVADGHILFWIKVDEVLNGSITRKVNDTTLTFRAYSEPPANITYSIDENTMTIVGLPEEGLDNSYFCEVTATRNNVDTAEKSGNYRVTNSPKAPILSYAGAPVDRTVYPIDKQNFRGQYATLSFEVEYPALSDSITYLWMRNILDSDADYNDYDQILAKIDLNGALAAILNEETAWAGNDDEICDGSVAQYSDGGIVFSGTSGNKNYELGSKDADGVYYCIVINELNNNKAASVGPFFYVR